MGTVNLKGTQYGENGKDFDLNSDQNFKPGDKVLLWHHFNNNGLEWTTAEHATIEEEEFANKSHPSQSDMSGHTWYCGGIATVTRVFKRKMWVK